ncbi:hypothetical protein CHGG_07218 [Chaetomium globosum CBS 148.51]|uniref:Uncharacterized protein n=1 Tax=Chaetomium globosum (strain ATCC 6205 / CBS 148.51 / DSM 1962 / NBRC 6347 / NRRL 1970) TaxID=306901 RepID=Q2GXT6_CHAGB|nr:uncharacterized protein CHGG_07218 [Chaetomium globosum CBS 148.51]EAQ85965.1 hypothetical protein CHGG_07218 [Chaetomium globosum CBS 148.51]
MVEWDAIETLLETGSWRTARSRSPHPYDSQRRAYEPSKPNIGIPRAAGTTTRIKRPPPPCVEDEDESLAKEHLSSVVSDSSDEGPKHRGEIDQQPILLPVHEHNPERRFVIVPGAAGEDAPKTTQARYDANTCRKYVIVPSEKDAESGESGNEDRRKRDSPKENPPGFEERPGSRKGRPEIVKRKSHQDLPRLTTDLHPEEPSIRRSSSRRDREKPLVHQEAQGYSSSRDRSSARPSDNDFLSPAAVKSKSSRRRDRAYSDVRSDAGPRSGRSPPTRRDAEVEVADGKRSHHSSRYSVSPGAHRRASSTTNVPTQDGGWSKPLSQQPSGYYNDDDILAFMAPGDDFMAEKPRRDMSPPRRIRNSNSPPHPRGARVMPGSPTRKRQPRSSNRDRDGYSSDDSYKERRHNRSERLYSTRPTLEPDEGRRSAARLAAVPSLAAPFSDEGLQPSPRSATFPTDKSRKVGERSMSPSPAASASPSRRPAQVKAAQPGVHSRDASVGSANGSTTLPPPVSGTLPRAATLDRPVPAAVATLARQESSDVQSPTLYWQPGRSEQGAADDDVTSHALAQLPDCQWKYPTLARNKPGSEQFLTLKRAENFEICPGCYRVLFANTEFQHMFVPAPIRTGEQLISCDFGASPWYRIAYLLTLKHDFPDLRLLQGIASVAARTQACAGSKSASRVWYSMMAPNSRRPIPRFNVCLSCTKMIEVLLPNLAGIFVPLSSHEATHNICELHYVPERKRFFDYFEEMKTTSDKALTRRTAPDLMELVDRVREISIHDECLRNTPISNYKWHIMERVPEFTVCEECFNAVVWPMIEDEDNGSEMPRNFYKYRQTKPLAACQLYSDRMRRVFLEACKYDDFEFLTSCVLNRLQTLAEVRARYSELQRESQEDPAVQDELAALARRFKDVE